MKILGLIVSSPRATAKVRERDKQHQDEGKEMIDIKRFGKRGQKRFSYLGDDSVEGGEHQDGIIKV